MNILVACEESQILTKNFRDLGHVAFSCDILDTSGARPDWHIKDNVLNHLIGWDMIVAFPPCTHLSSSGARWFSEKRKDGRQENAIAFFMALINAPCQYIAIENPVGIMSTIYRKPDQIIHPWQFGHGETKATCLWLKNLPRLVPTFIVEGREQRIFKMPPSPERSKYRSKTYPGIAQAMALQWSPVPRPPSPVSLLPPVGLMPKG